MTQFKRQFILISIMLATLAVAVLWSFSSLKSGRKTASLAYNDLKQCEFYATEIESLRDVPTVAASADMEVHEFARLVEKASSSARMTAHNVQGLSPQSPRRLGSSPYMQNPTEISLKGVSMVQLVSFLYSLCDGSGLSVSDLRIWVPYTDSAKEIWDAEVTLSYLVYSPQPKSGSGR